MAPPKPQPKRYSLSFMMFKFELENGSDLCFWHLGFEKTISFQLEIVFAFIFPYCLVAEKIVKENFCLFVCYLYDVIMLTHMPVQLESKI